MRIIFKLLFVSFLLKVPGIVFRLMQKIRVEPLNTELDKIAERERKKYIS